MNLATILYLAVSALCMAAVASWFIVRLCNAYARPDAALAAILRLAYHMIYAAEAGQIGLAHFRQAKHINRARLAQAMQPVVLPRGE